MATMTDIEVKQQLAKAIGWPERQIRVRKGVVLVGRHRRVFDYREPNVIWPLAVAFNAFPIRGPGGWVADSARNGVVLPTLLSASPEKATAVMIIRMKAQNIDEQ